MTNEFRIRLKEGRERSLLRGHPWIFSGALDEHQDAPIPFGATVEIYSQQGEWLARGAYSPQSQIRVRVWTWDADQVVDAAFLRGRLEAAIAARTSLRVDSGFSAFREVYAESDGLPGLIVDRYNRHRVLQFLSAGAEHWRQPLIEALQNIGACEGMIERSDVDVRKLEGLEPQSGLLWGAPPPAKMTVAEAGLEFQVDLLEGHKTGFYLDQRLNRLLLRQLIDGGEVLDAFSYSGGFSLNALKGGAEQVTAIDSSAAALEMLRQNAELNQLPGEKLQTVAGDVFQELRALRDRRRSFDVIILDPPKFAPTISQVQQASRGYKDINLLAFKLLRPGGLLFTFSCSGGVSAELFQKIVAGAAVDAGVQASVIAWMNQPFDHPVPLAFPEASYLKGLVCRRR